MRNSAGSRRSRTRYNDERPHEGIGDRTPTSLWRPSPRAYPEHRIYYRRDDTEAYAGRLHERLGGCFGIEQVFLDQFSIKSGESSDWTIQQAAVHCEAMIVLVGPRWLTVADGASHPRLQDEADFVHREITEALDRNTLVIPVIVPLGAIPVAQQLPYDMRGLERLQALDLTARHWDADVTTLIDTIERILRPGAGV